MKNLTHLFFLLLFSQINAQTIVEQKLSSCDESAEVNLIQTRLVEKKIENGVLLLSIGFAANCCYAPESSIRVSNDTIYLTNKNSRMPIAFVLVVLNWNLKLQESSTPILC